MARLHVPVAYVSLVLLALSAVLVACSDDEPLHPFVKTGTVVIGASPDTLAPPWLLEGPGGSLAPGAGDSILQDLAVGRYRLTWESVSGWALPVPEVRSDSLAAGDSLVFTGTYFPLPETGSVAVAITPDTLAAPWLLEGPDFFSYPGVGSLVLGNIPVGDYTVTWQGLEGWVNPGPFTVASAVTEDDTTVFSHTYAPGPCNCGDLTIAHFSPGEEYAFFWELTRMQDEDFFIEGEGDTTLIGLPLDYYRVLYRPILGFRVDFGPFQEHEGNVAVVRIREGVDNVVYGVYVPDEDNMGLLTITPVPVDLESPWTLTTANGFDLPGTGGGSILVTPNTYTLTWGEVPGWASPSPLTQTLTLPLAGSIEFTGRYLALSPLQVEGFTTRAGEQTGEIDLAWTAVENVQIPIADYLVAGNTAGPITVDNWSGADLLATIPAQVGQETYQLTLAPGTHGLVPGQPIWLAVRARNEQGVLSPLTPETVEIPTFDRTITGRLTDGLGRAVTGAPVALLAGSHPALEAVTDGSGAFAFPGIASNDSFILETRTAEWQPGAWFDFRFTGLEDEDPGEIAIGLIPRYETDAACADRYADFLDYLLQMTKTDGPTNDRPDQRLHKWDHFPLEIYLPDNPPAVGYDFPALTRLAMDQWNATMGMDLFTETADSLNAEVVVSFSDAVPQVNGQVVMLAPPGVRYLGDAVPEQMGLYLNIGVFPEQRIIEVAMHEMGHILGIYDHSLCSEAGYLMYITSAGALDQGIENAIHPDEQALVRTIVNLPQGVDMSRYYR